MARLTKLERWAVLECVMHCEAAGTELDFLDAYDEATRDKIAGAIANASMKMEADEPKFLAAHKRSR